MTENRSDLDGILAQAFDPEQFRRNGHKLIDLLADYLDTSMKGEEIPVLPWESPDEMRQRWRQDFLKQPENSFIELCKDILHYSIHLHHPRNMGHQIAVPAPEAALFELLSALLNNSMAVYEVGPASSAIESIVIDWLCSVLGYGAGSGGVLTSGGSIGNLTALLAARQNKAGYDAWNDGPTGDRSLAVMISSQSHYSSIRAVKIMGLGEQGIVKLPVNREFQIDPDRLEETFQKAQAEGKRVIGLVANACTTSVGVYDPLEEIADFCRRHDIWLHVDAAHGGGAALSGKYRHRLKGIEHADSVVVDFHKMMLTPALTTAVVFKNGHNAYETFVQKAVYLLDNQRKENWSDIAQRTLECTKKMMGIKVYGLLKLYGVELFDEFVTGTYDLAASCARILEQGEDFELPVAPEANILCFRYIPGNRKEEEYNRLNLEIREYIKEKGEFYIVRTEINGKVYLRVTLMNPFTTLEDFQELLHTIRSYPHGK